MVEIDEIFYKLDRFIIEEIWLKYDEIAFEDISKHLSMDSIINGDFKRNFKKVMKDRNSGHE